MKKIAIVLLALMLMLCACSNQTSNTESGSKNDATSVSDNASTTKGSKGTKEDEAADKGAVTLPEVEADDEAGAVEFSEINGDDSGKKNNDKDKKDKKDKEDTEDTTKGSNEEGAPYELPRVPLG